MMTTVSGNSMSSETWIEFKLYIYIACRISKFIDYKV